MLSFTTHAPCPCSSCSRGASYGFFHGTLDAGERFFCSGCAQREFAQDNLEGAIDAHRQMCFDLTTRIPEDDDLLGEVKDDHHRDMVIAGWMERAEEMCA